MPQLCYNLQRLTALGSADSTAKGLTTMLVTGRQSVMAKPSLPENRFYAYILRRPDKVDPFDPEKGAPFYVGKGYGERKDCHRRECLRFVRKGMVFNRIKNNIIAYLWRVGLDFEIDIIENEMTEEEAFYYEKEFILTYGRKIDKTGILIKFNGWWRRHLWLYTV